MQTAFLIVLSFLGLADLAFSNGSLAPISLLFVAVSVQANMAAARFLKEGLKSEPFAYPSWYTGAPKAETKTEATEKPKAAPEQLKVAPLPKTKAKKNRPNAAPPLSSSRSENTQPFFQAPKFQGQPHEVLGIQENSPTRLIVQAFRHWIKRYHPDHNLRPEQTAGVTEKARQITTAKECLLEKRRRMREHSAA